MNGEGPFIDCFPDEAVSQDAGRHLRKAENKDALVLFPIHVVRTLPSAKVVTTALALVYRNQSTGHRVGNVNEFN